MGLTMTTKPISIDANGAATPVPHIEKAISVQARTLSCISGPKATLYLDPSPLADLRLLTKPHCRKTGGDSGFPARNSEQDGRSQKDGFLPNALPPIADTSASWERINIVDNSPSVLASVLLMQPVDKYRKSTRWCVCG